ncbi:DUF4430 domain-containing protein [Streptomyces nanshensis]|uniref:Transcobalamin-like C-terminal domain-containing protein n=1 Tax=Streptomyces nanshensis TaxID=518642 RepID=A0A1E7KVM3_9ACTN|nr:DUF4430 domain-containing protein [Streptomyces nanshensis]OEV07972.1 hypothetical protein AN218_28205 [Streptomyces nanshensis]
MRRRLVQLPVAASVLGLALTVAAPAAAEARTPQTAAAVTVHLTVTGPDGAVYDKDLKTTGHTVSAATGGEHKCDGTNNGANSSAGATPTAALDDAAQAADFTWDGTWYASYEDYFVTTIDGDAQTADAYWNISVNGEATSVGGCQHKLSAGDDVAFTWTAM